MRTTTARNPARRKTTRLPPALDRRFEAVVFDWDGAASPDRGANASELRALVEKLCAHGLDFVVVAGGHVDEVDGKLHARPSGPGSLYLCVDRGSEVHRATEHGLELVERRTATPTEEAALDRAAAATVAELGRRGLVAEVVSERLDRRRIHLVPELEWAEWSKERAAELQAAAQDRLRVAGLSGVGAALEIAVAAARDGGLADPRVTGDATHIEIGLTDTSDSARWAFAELARRGIGPGLVLVAGDEFGFLEGLRGTDRLLLPPEGARATVISLGTEPSGTPAHVLALGGGPARFREVLVDQLERRRRWDVPEVDDDPDWILAVDGVDPQLERVHEAHLALADGRLGTRGAPTFGHPAAEPAVVLAGAYDGEGPASMLARCPDWTRLSHATRNRPRIRRRLDLATGLLREDGPVTSLRFSSLARPGTVALRALADPRTPIQRRRRRATPLVTAALRDRSRGRAFERLGTYDAEPEVARAGLADAEGAGFERLLREHREAWVRRWRDADVVVEGDPELQRAMRFALFHLMSSVADRDEAAVGARGLSGPAYGGHVFWDSDVFVLPFLAATHPAAARAMLEYRVRRLPAACEAARVLGRRGARFAWESARDGRDVTPASARLATGEVVRIRTGELEEHIVGDVAWAAAHYLAWTGDEDFSTGAGRTLLVETARYWASRVRLDDDGRAHIYGVIGPDEYHGPVDDNAFTNVLARWNLRFAAALDGLAGDERASWLAIADALVDGFDRASGLYEQFSGFFDLEPLIIEEVAPRRPIAADLLLGAERIAGAQVLKQADVLMLHHLLPDEVARGSLVPNLDYYEPRTAHGSSLSPAINASLLARAGRFRAALEALRIAARIDLDDLTGTTAGGLHLGAMGGLWQALVFGFGGVRPRGETLLVEPRLPPEWNALELALRFRRTRLRLRIDREGVSASPSGWQVRQTDDRWEVTPA